MRFVNPSRHLTALQMRSRVLFLTIPPFLALVVAAWVFVYQSHPRARHFTSNSNFDAAGTFLPARAGFDLADVGGRYQLDRLPSGVEGLVWVGMCDGVTPEFRAQVDPVIKHPKLFGFYLMDGPDPMGKWRPQCRADDLRAEADYIHAAQPGAVVFISLMNIGSSAAPAFSPDYAPERSGVDLFGVAAYPCRSDWASCDYDLIDRSVAAAVAAGVPLKRITPIYQTFGAGGWQADAGGAYRMPSAEEMRTILSHWDRDTPSPRFDYAYSWGGQNLDTALRDSSELQAVLAERQTHGAMLVLRP